MRTLSLIALLAVTSLAPAQVLDKQKLLDAQTFWETIDPIPRISNSPLVDCPVFSIFAVHFQNDTDMADLIKIAEQELAGKYVQHPRR